LNGNRDQEMDWVTQTACIVNCFIF
jgi:hypothetical protein